MDVKHVRSLLAVAECGSFAEAGRRLGIARSSLRAHIETLEGDLGGPLLERNSRGTALTSFGTAVMPRARELVVLADSMVDRRQPESLVTIQVPAGVPPVLHMALRQAFVARLPGVSFRMVVDARGVRPEADLVFQIGCQVAAPEDYRTYVANRVTERVLGHPDYLARSGRPKTLKELREHALMTWCPPGEDPQLWSGRGGPHRVKVENACEDLAIVREFVNMGLGLARVPDLPMYGFEPVLPEVFGREVVLHVLIPERSANNPVVRTAVAVLEQVRSTLFPD
jgi:DNA-binding transcriptional LysR family regulator